jgi:hypothetical protein
VAGETVPFRVVAWSRFPTLDDYDRTSHRYRAEFVHQTGYVVDFDAFPGADIVDTIEDPEPEQGGPGKQQTMEIKKLRLPPGTAGFDFALRSEDGTFRRTKSTDLRPHLRDLRGVINEAQPGQEWHWQVRVPREGPYTASVRLRNESGGGPRYEHRLVIRDYYIVGLGDSFASGEGNPDRIGRVDDLNALRCDATTPEMLVEGLADKVNIDVPAVSMNIEPVWLEPRAHRSLLAGHARGVRAAETLWDGRVITFTSFASTGATIDRGLLERQHPWQPAGGQIEEARNAAAGKHVDAVLLSIGGNDVGFSSGLRDLASDWRSGGPTEMRQATRKKINDLENRLAALAERLTADLSPDRVFVTEYPTGFFDKPGPLPGTGRRADGCGVFDTGAYLKVSGVDADTIFGLAHELNTKIRSIVDKHHNWTYVGGIIEGFTGHGYCAPEPFFVSATRSCHEQGDFLGTMHPNQGGQAVYSRAVTQALRRYFDQHPTEPRTWLEPVLQTMMR